MNQYYELIDMFVSYVICFKSIFFYKSQSKLLFTRHEGHRQFDIFYTVIMENNMKN